MAQTISFRAPKELSERLDIVASETERKKTFHIIKAIEHYLDKYADLQISLDRLKNKDDKLISIKEVNSRYLLCGGK